MAKYITTVLKGFFPSSILDKLSYDLTRSSLTVYMYVGGLLNNVEQHANIDHNNDVDNHVNLGLATV
jgi:predicted lipase